MDFRLFILSLIVLPCLLLGCATTSDSADSDAEDEEKTVSTLPWNKPQKWERSGAGAGGRGVSY